MFGRAHPVRGNPSARSTDRRAREWTIPAKLGTPAPRVVAVPAAAVCIPAPTVLRASASCVLGKRPRMGSDSAPVASASPLEFDPAWGPRLREFVSSSELGSFQRMELVKDAREGVRFAQFVRDRPWPRMPSGFLDDQQHDVDAAFYAAQHCGPVSAARRSIVRYEAFCTANAHRLRSPEPYQSVSVDVVAAFLRDVSASAGRARGASDAGCSSPSVLDGLALAHVLARAPFPPELLADRRVLAAISSPAPRPAPMSAHMPLSAMLLLEDIALGGYWDEFRSSPFPWGAAMQGPFCVHTARTLWVISILSFRGVDGLRARVLPTETEEPRLPPRVEQLDGPNVSRVVVRYSSRKACLAGRKKRKGAVAPLVEFDVFVPHRGILPGVERWLHEWASSMSHRPFLFPRFKSPRAGSPLGATEWIESSMSKVHLQTAWEVLLSPIFAPAAMKAMRLTLHGPRHILPEIGKQYGMSLEERNELGRWADSNAAAGAGRAKQPSRMADLYSREGPAHDSELASRLKIIRRVSEFIGVRPWGDVVPTQLGERCSFSFLSLP